MAQVPHRVCRGLLPLVLPCRIYSNSRSTVRVLVLLVVFPRRRRAPGTGATYKFREGVVGVTGLVCRCTLAVPSRGRATGARVVKFEVVPLMRRTDLATGGVVRIHGIGLHSECRTWTIRGSAQKRCPFMSCAIVCSRTGSSAAAIAALASRYLTGSLQHVSTSR